MIRWMERIQQQMSPLTAPENCAVLSVWGATLASESPTTSASIACTDFALAQAREAAIQGIEALYSLRNASVVRHFLRDHPEVIESLIEARPYLEEHFGPDTRAWLEVVGDPEAADERQLFAYIASGLPVDEAVKRLDAFDEGWFLDHVDRVAGRLNFNLEFA